ncbi:MAG: hypothetical protein J5673_04495 [Candidatus Methanomethylophilaceae archaeon]|nr:hypothetical protein [Candidatus Methanomethylophilaceae archaeon]
MPLFDGMEFTGPVEIGMIPNVPGVYIITTDASGGVKILGAYDGGDDMNSSAKNNPKRTCWERNRKDSDPVAYCIAESDGRRRESICKGLIERRFYEMVCNDPPRDEF